MKKLMAALAFLALPLTAQADGTQDSFNRINQCVQKEDAQGCRDMVTASSAPIYGRFVDYGLFPCLPKDVSYLSEEPNAGYTLIRAKTNLGNKDRTLRLAFIEEENAWKLDIPASLQAGLGPKWENKFNMTEQLYLLMRQQSGGRLTCAMLLDLLKR